MLRLSRVRDGFWFAMLELFRKDRTGKGIMVTPNYDTPAFISQVKQFNYNKHGRRTSNIFAIRRGESDNEYAYEIYSYWTLMATVKNGEVAYLDNRYYSRTTSKHQGYIMAGLGGFPVAEDAEVHERPKKGKRR